MVFRLQSVITRTIYASFLSYFVHSRLFTLLTGMREIAFAEIVFPNRRSRFIYGQSVSMELFRVRVKVSYGLGKIWRLLEVVLVWDCQFVENLTHSSGSYFFLFWKGGKGGGGSS